MPAHVRSGNIRRRLAAGAALAVALAACTGSGEAENGAPTTGMGEASTADTRTDELEEHVDDLQQILDTWRVDEGAFGATLSVRVPGAGDIHLASGLDGLDPETQMPTEGTFRVASITKTFIAALALQLVDDGLLSLTEPVATHVPELPNADRITLGMLLDHTAGFGDDAFAAMLTRLLDDPGRSYSPEEATELWLAPSPLDEPGTTFAYSNPGYMAAGILIERALEQDLAELIEERLTEPLGLTDTVLGDESIGATRHAWYNEDREATNIVDITTLPQDAAATLSWAAGGIISTSADILEWGDALYSGEVLGEETTATMLEMRNSYRDYQQYGLGVMGFCNELDCQPEDVGVVGHRGFFPGSKSLLAHHLDSGVTMIVNSNYSDVDFRQLLSASFRELGIAWEAPIE
jgi:D-alanyl-D-alanine carboxypeptidase